MSTVQSVINLSDINLESIKIYIIINFKILKN